MISRDFGSTYRAGCAGAPPPLHVVDDNPQSAWFPVRRPQLQPHPPGPVMVLIPTPAPFGDDPMDPTAQTARRHGTNGMIARLNLAVVASNVRGQGVRQ